jgi:hypothetical protein
MILLVLLLQLKLRRRQPQQSDRFCVLREHRRSQISGEYQICLLSYGAFCDGQFVALSHLVFVSVRVFCISDERSFQLARKLWHCSRLSCAADGFRDWVGIPRIGVSCAPHPATGGVFGAPGPSTAEGAPGPGAGFGAPGPTAPEAAPGPMAWADASVRYSPVSTTNVHGSNPRNVKSNPLIVFLAFPAF